mgnify:CR=1 FL=1
MPLKGQETSSPRARPFQGTPGCSPLQRHACLAPGGARVIRFYQCPRVSLRRIAGPSPTHQRQFAPAAGVRWSGENRPKLVEQRSGGPFAPSRGAVGRSRARPRTLTGVGGAPCPRCPPACGGTRAPTALLLPPPTRGRPCPSPTHAVRCTALPRGARHGGPR